MKFVEAVLVVVVVIMLLLIIMTFNPSTASFLIPPSGSIDHAEKTYYGLGIILGMQQVMSLYMLIVVHRFKSKPILPVGKLVFINVVVVTCVGIGVFFNTAILPWSIPVVN